jgi:P27 family predicted phage terminase small subunit
MGRSRGRKPDPPELKVFKSAQRRAAGPFAGVRDGGAPAKPATIADDQVAADEWDRLVELLDGRRILSPADMAVVAVYCSAWSTICRCREMLRVQKVVRLDPNTGEAVVEEFDPFLVTNRMTGVVKIHPAVGVLSGAERTLVSVAAELGLSPTARGRVVTLEDLHKPDSKLSRFIT